MANATQPLVGRSVGHERAVPVATSGYFGWPPPGSSYWPLTPGLAGKKHNAALVCLSRRRCDVLFAMLRNHQPYRPPQHAKQPAAA